MKPVMALERVVNRFELVFCFCKKPIEQLGKDGFYHGVGSARGILVKRIHIPTGEVWYHYPYDYLKWKNIDIKTC